MYAWNVLCLAMIHDGILIRYLIAQQYLVTIAGNYTGWSNFWIGLNDRNDEGGYVWTDGRPVTYTNWSTHQPNDWSGSQDCVEVLLYGSRTLINTWNDLSCSASRPFICEYPAGKRSLVRTSLTLSCLSLSTAY